MIKRNGLHLAGVGFLQGIKQKCRNRLARVPNLYGLVRRGNPLGTGIGRSRRGGGNIVGNRYIAIDWRFIRIKRFGMFVSSSFTALIPGDELFMQRKERGLCMLLFKLVGQIDKRVFGLARIVID